MSALKPDTLATSATLSTCRPDTMNWVPWAMPGAQFKLLHADAKSGSFTLLIRFEAGAEAPIHRHVGAVEGYMLEGGFFYKDDPDTRFDAGSYLYENEGAVHQPVSPHGGVMFAVFHGPVEGLDDHGNVTGRIHWKWHVKTWNAAGNHYVPDNLPDNLPD